ncbi:MAG: MaoC/PaaZ C-terminal domain-containing protein, partial [Acidimicrobiales bacterium]
ALGPDHRVDAAVRSASPTAKVAQHVDDDQTFRYGPAAGDPMPIHLDADVARDAGLPGVIAHGLCTMAFASWALLTSVGESRRLHRLAVRFAKPVLPGQDLDTTVWRAGASTYAFETTVGETVVLKDGLAEFTDFTD